MTIPEDFKTRLKIAKTKLKKNIQIDSEKRGSFMGSAFKLGTELVAAVAVGTIIGFILDTWFDTKPWLIIIFFFLGAAAGMLNVIRAANNVVKQISLFECIRSMLCFFINLHSDIIFDGKFISVLKNSLIFWGLPIL